VDREEPADECDDILLAAQVVAEAFAHVAPGEDRFGLRSDVLEERLDWFLVLHPSDTDRRLLAAALQKLFSKLRLPVSEARCT
jgi:hypothetical protein